MERGDIRFFELAALDVEVTAGANRQDAKDAKEPLKNLGDHGVLAVQIHLRDFVVHPDDVPQDVQQAITHWSQWIDYWAVDFNFQGDTFHNEWQAYRTKKSPQLQTGVAHRYEQPGTYMVVVKVIDILGNDTTKSLLVEVG